MFRDLKSPSQWSRSLVIGAALACATYSVSSSQPIAQPSYFLFEAPKQTDSEPSENGEQATRRSGLFFYQAVYAERAARLIEPVKIAKGPWGMSRVLPAGTMLFSVLDRPRNVYCAPALEKGRLMWGTAYPCFEDADGDGVFETSRWAEEQINDVALTGLVETGEITNLIFVRGKPSPVQVRYEQAAHTDGPKTSLLTSWDLDFQSGQKTTTRIRISSTLGYRARSNPLVVDLPQGETRRITYRGAVIDLLEATADGGLRYRVVTPPPPTREYVQPTVMALDRAY